MNFDYIKNNFNAAPGDEKHKGSNEFINQNQTSKRIFEELEKTKSEDQLKENPIKKMKLDIVPDSKKASFEIEKDENSTNVIFSLEVLNNSEIFFFKSSLFKNP